VAGVAGTLDQSLEAAVAVARPQRRKKALRDPFQM
jgi:hypothetical protein